MSAKIKNWTKFQHYKNRRPPWIRLYRDLLDDPEFEKLSGELAKTLIKLWLAVSDFSVDGELPAIERLALRMHIASDVLADHISKLNHWVSYNASYMLATCERHAIPEGEQREISESDQRESNIDPSLRSGSPNISVSTQESNTSYQLLPVSTSKDSDKTKTKTKGKGKARGRGGNGEAKSTATWNAYADAYARRYGVSPVRNAKTSSLCCRIVDAIGADDAPRVASYYPSSNYGYYVARGHALELCLSDCQKLLTELETGNRTTQTKAREADRLQHSGDGWKKIIEEMGE
jgi:hypothetical protein